MVFSLKLETTGMYNSDRLLARLPPDIVISKSSKQVCQKRRKTSLFDFLTLSTNATNIFFFFSLVCVPQLGKSLLFSSTPQSF